MNYIEQNYDHPILLNQQMKAMRNFFLPSYLHSCTNPATTTTTKTNITINDDSSHRRRKIKNISSSVGGGGDGGAICCLKYNNYETTVETTTLPQQQKQQNQSVNQRQSMEQHQHVRSSRNGRERHRNFHMNCMALTENRQQLRKLQPKLQHDKIANDQRASFNNIVVDSLSSSSSSSSSLLPSTTFSTAAPDLLTMDKVVARNTYLQDGGSSNLRVKNSKLFTPNDVNCGEYDDDDDDFDKDDDDGCDGSSSSSSNNNKNTKSNNSSSDIRLIENTVETAKYTNGCNNFSHTTTTLECTRCFKDNGDIMFGLRGMNVLDLKLLQQNGGEKISNCNSNSSCEKSFSSSLSSSSFSSPFSINKLSRRTILYQLTAFVTKTITALRIFLMMTLLMLLTTSVSCWSSRQDMLSNCTFPARWEGSWFLSGYQQSIHIKGSQFSYRGKCAASDGNKYLIVDEKGCHRCLVIYEKHKNVLQYKENFCKGRETLQNLCDQIPGDALLYSLFRESAEPVKCPLKGPFVFTYNRGHGECKSPVSNIESCTEDSRLLLSFQACPDVQGTESTVEELTCLATWKDGNSRYLVGLVSHHHAISNEERFRCFVYEKISSLMGTLTSTNLKDAEYKLAQSGDATCNGLDSAEVGSRIMSLRKPPTAERCDFPVWFKGPRHWHALMGNAVYNFHSNDGSIHIIKPNGYMETRALCEQINKQTSTEMMAVVHYTTGCQSGFMCMMFYRRDTHVIEIQTGKQASRLEDACAIDHFDISKMPFITLLASNPDPEHCPMEGLYNLRGAIGPPYVTTRHKRNHNNKAHGGHGHHHQMGDPEMHDNNFGNKRHGTLSFRNSERMEKGSWHANTRGLPIRSRRAAAANNVVNNKNSTTTITTSNGTSIMFVSNDLDIDIDMKQRNRRNAQPCIVNYKAQRQLWVGCTEPNAIDVRPLCTDEGDEEYSCFGSWTENNTVYTIARHKGTKHGVCISYRPTEGSSLKLVIGDACYRGTQKPPDHHLVADISVFGKCGETGNGSIQIHQSSTFLIFLKAALLLIINIFVNKR